MTYEKNEEKRRFHRIFYNAGAVLDGAGTLKGCLLSFDQPCQGAFDTFYTLRLNLTDEISIVMDVSVVHVDGNQAGFKCRHIDIDSISRLRRLVELNLGDSNLLERELAALSDLGAGNQENT